MRTLRISLWLSAVLLSANIASATPPADLVALSPERVQHLEKLGVTRWHQLGQRGHGFKIAVLDTGFRGWREYLGKGLPDEVTTRSFRSDGNLEARDSQHGILCGEVLHSLAPEAELLFANWDTDSPASFLKAVRWAKEQGARILTCSVIQPSWSDGEGGGPTHAELDKLLGKDLLFFASAGNTAQRHWSGVLRPNAQGWHQWQTDTVTNPLEPWGSERVAVELYGAIECSGELQVVDNTSGALIGQATLGRNPDGTVSDKAIVRFDPAPRHAYEVRLKAGGDCSTKGKFHVVVLGGNLEHAQAGGSIAFPADGARVQAVGAVDRRGLRAAYSACGPNSRQPKPDFVAMVPFASQCRDRPFSGTSAASPQAAALAALVWSRHPGWTSAQVTSALHAAAFDLGPVGHDYETGFGLVRLP